MTIRLMNLGTVPYLHSQTIYHAVAHAMGEASADTITLMTPDRPYVCVGYHQDAARDVDLDFCQERSLPVLRRAIGGGTVLLDERQLFFHCIFHHRRAPRRVAELYRLVLGAPIRAFRRLGISAEMVPPNDIQCAGRKLAGSGAGQVGDAVVVGGSIIFGFDRETMARAVRCPSPLFRAQVRACLDEHMSSLDDELAASVDPADVTASLIDSFAHQLDTQLAPGQMTDGELEERARLDQEFPSLEWLHGMRRASQPVHCVKIASHVYVCGARHAGPGATADVVVSTRGRTMREVHVACAPPLDGPAMERLRSDLRGLPLEEQHVRPVLARWGRGARAGEAAAAILRCLMDVREHLEGVTG